VNSGAGLSDGGAGSPVGAAGAEGEGVAMLRGPVLAVICAVFVSLLSIDGGFVGDDRSALLESPVVQGAVPVGEAFVRDVWGNPASDGVNTYRPLSPMLWRAEWVFGGGSPLLFRVMSLLFHAGAVLLAWLCLRALGAGERVSATAAVFFAIHAVGTEAEAAIVGQSDVLSAALGLAALLVVLRARSAAGAVGATALLLLAVAVKESAVLFAVVIPVLAAARKPAGWRGAVVGSAVVLAAAVAIQASLERASITTTWNNSLGYDAHGAQRLLLGAYLVGRAALLCLVPTGLSPSHGFAAIDFSAETLGPLAAVGVVALLVAAAFGVRALLRRDGLMAFALMALMGPAVLVSHLVFVIMSDLPERLLYPSALGVSLLLAVLLDRFAGKLFLFSTVAYAAVLLLTGVPLRRAWTSDNSLWTYAVVSEPKSIRTQMNYSNSALREGRPDDAAWHRMVGIYLVNSYPDRVDWPKVEKLRERGLEQAWRDAPGVLYPENPCPLVVTFLTDSTRVDPAFGAFGVRELSPRYPACFAPQPR
jgi:hypothetical protein